MDLGAAVLVERLQLAHPRRLEPPALLAVRFREVLPLLILTALTLTGANVAGYVRCKQDARSKIMGGLTSLAARTGMSTAAGNMMQSAAGTAFGFK